MQITEVEYSSIKPGSENKKVFTVLEFEEQFLKASGEKILPFINTYNKYASTSNSTVLRDLIKNLEEYFKSKPLDDANKKIIITKVFDSIKNQLQILECLQIDNNDSELLVMLFSTIFSHFKKFLC
jgi:hypothetical protein